MSVITLADLMQRRGAPALDRKIVDETQHAAPLFKRLPSRVISGTVYRYMKRDTLPKVGPRPINAGAEAHKASYKSANAECHYYDGVIMLDKALADADPDGRNELMADEARATMKGTMFGLEQSLFYPQEFGAPCLRQTIGDYMAMSANPNIKDETAWTAGGASVWLLHVADGALENIFGNSKAIAFGPIEKQDVQRPTGKADGSMGSMTALIQHCSFWRGFVQKNVFAVDAILNESADNPLTDEMLAKAVDMFPASMRPNLIVMNPATRSRLRASRSTAITYRKGQSGQTAYAVTPTEWDGIEIMVTDGIINDETPEKIAEFMSKSDYSAADMLDTTKITNPNKIV
jgi:hypothetical protein